MRRARFAVVGLLALVAAGSAAAQGASGFDHSRHARVFPSCTACHPGAENSDTTIWPDPARCAACHDGSTMPKVSWQPPQKPHPSNLKFVHDLVPLMTHQTPRGVEQLSCVDCHTPPGAPWMTVQRAQADRCMQCHAPGATHATAPDSLCSTCHLPLVRAASLTGTDVAAFPAPPSHGAPEWVSRAGHGALAAAGAQSCAVCHARDFCMTCHVDAPEQPAIQALDPDPRSRAIVVHLRPPASHRDPAFLQQHGAMVRANPQQCSTCHTRESCLACHASSQGVGVALHASGPGRAAGAQPQRAQPPSHRENFVRRHASVAAATPASCAGCHVRTDCLQCHRPDAAANATGYHPAGFLQRHPAAAYSRETRCADCHNTAGFCQTCHASAGLVAARGPLGAGYHDASPTFSAGHGQAARQSLESCTACHAERDCLTCHSALGGRRFNPHGPGFDAERLKRKNAQMCTVCHGAAIP
jgi:Cytochrome c7 and related cytochrome c/Doubled CXXCH motif (Paired_CXXCH_1)